jgi:hypothetical protein
MALRFTFQNCLGLCFHASESYNKPESHVQTPSSDGMRIELPARLRLSRLVSRSLVNSAERRGERRQLWIG